MVDIREEFESWFASKAECGEIGKRKTDEQERHDQLADKFARAVFGDEAQADDAGYMGR